jgi:hypothetical protein
MDLPRWWKIDTAGPSEVQSCSSWEETCVFFMRPSPPESISEIFLNRESRQIDCITNNHCDLASRSSY